MSPHRSCAVALGLALAGCAGGNGRFIGTMTTEQGACGPGFDSAGQAAAVLIVQGEEVQFAPTQGVLVLRGKVNDAGHVVASNSTAGADRKPFLMVFEGDRTGDGVQGRFASPRCRATVLLTR